MCGKSSAELMGNGNQVLIKTMAGVALFCALEKFINYEKSAGALRYDIGRDSNTDMMLVGVPLLFTWTPDKLLKGHGKMKVQMATVRVNGDSARPASWTWSSRRRRRARAGGSGPRATWT